MLSVMSIMKQTDHRPDEKLKSDCKKPSPRFLSLIRKKERASGKNRSMCKALIPFLARIDRFFPLSHVPRRFPFTYPPGKLLINEDDWYS
ncbi:hypothetical protein ACH95_10420 [Bacillus glycinifermentans]|uniref:Uncharacterized protein n=1 Tax=Bacillus glycinifermentans TaxID=1664069 RepID=A0A0J6EQT5_9BACI|nr:hypothetical protein ACH95_10420 [Bacillus glycinifermentans]KRT95305.1 hypothetical protein AB447_212470 [Bacillus glycinifermentans]